MCLLRDRTGSECQTGARVAELADAPDLGSGAVRLGGSSPPLRIDRRSLNSGSHPVQCRSTLSRPRSRMRRLLALCSAIALAACNHLDSPDLNITLPITESNVAGTFLLKSANGNAPPYVLFSNASGSRTLLNDRMVIHDDQTWADTTNYRDDLSDGSSALRFSVTSGTY